MAFALIQCDQDGVPVQAVREMPDALAANCRATADLYRRAGFIIPWVGYVASVDGRGVGGGAFVGPPTDGLVEIAYFTLQHEQDKGYATQTAAELVKIARAHRPEVGLKAFTLKETNPSTRFLERLGFVIVGVSIDVDAGEVWEWRA